MRTLCHLLVGGTTTKSQLKMGKHLCNYISRKVREGLAVWIQLVQRIADVELLGGRYIWCPAQTIWHIDGNHKLIRWRFVVHRGIDGYSRMIT